MDSRICEQFGEIDIYLFDQLLRGRITPGARADLTIVTPDFGAAGTIVDGRLVWTSRYLESQVAVWA